jgi:peptidyl-prolyl cis-trans isomerase D
MKFAFSHKIGEVSRVISVTNGYTVFMVSEIQDAGVRPFDAVKTIIEPRVKREKRMEKLKGIVRSVREQLADGDDLQKAVSNHPNLSVAHITAGSLDGSIPGIGRDPGFSGAAATLTNGTISQPVEGSRGYYLIKLTGRTEFDSARYNAQKDALRSQLMTDKRNRVFTDWYENLKKKADIVDNRDLFYQ